MDENGHTNSKTKKGKIHVNNYVSPQSNGELIHENKTKRSKSHPTPLIRAETQGDSNTKGINTKGESSASESGMLGAGLEASFASLRRSSATPDLMNKNTGTEAGDTVRSKPNSPESRSTISAGSSPRLKRPPTVESTSVSIQETEVRTHCFTGCSVVVIRELDQLTFLSEHGRQNTGGTKFFSNVFVPEHEVVFFSRLGKCFKEEGD